MGKARLVYKGFFGEAEQVGDNHFKGRVINTPDPQELDGRGLAEIQLAFTRAVDQLVKNGVTPGAAPVEEGGLAQE